MHKPDTGQTTTRIIEFYTSNDAYQRADDGRITHFNIGQTTHELSRKNQIFTQPNPADNGHIRNTSPEMITYTTVMSHILFDRVFIADYESIIKA